MKLPLQITFKDIDVTESIEASVRRHAARLDRFFDRITRCHVVVSASKLGRRKGRLYNVRIDISVPQHEIVVDRAPAPDHAYEEFEVAIREAFNAAARQLEDHARRVRGDVKAHAPPPHGRVKALFPDKGYGFIESADGLEIYFHRNSVANDAFPQLEIGSEVRYVAQEKESEAGPQASTVIPVGKHHIAGPEAGGA
ncbi:MAG TPA: HPF/RaiA family ribosome-associated protein [Methylomirabilota bacterium]|nr:HPF/RaiA family ribosome-associated protein [Methylomirabilota bacterium]